MEYLLNVGKHSYLLKKKSHVVIISEIDLIKNNMNKINLLPIKIKINTYPVVFSSKLSTYSVGFTPNCSLKLFVK